MSVSERAYDDLVSGGMLYMSPFYLARVTVRELVKEVLSTFKLVCTDAKGVPLCLHFMTKMYTCILLYF